MKKLIISIILCGLSTFALASPDAPNQPFELTLDQMDSITSGAVQVSIRTNAWSNNRHSETYTNAKTKTGEFTRRGVTVEFGVGTGVAWACCGPNKGTSIEAGAAGTGDIVRTRASTNSTLNRRASLSTGYATVFTITINEGYSPSKKFIKKMKKRAKKKIRKNLKRMRRSM